MSDEELRVEIAEQMGGIWVRLIDTDPHRSLIMPDRDFGQLNRANMTESILQIHDIPNYLTDWNTRPLLIAQLNHLQLLLLATALETPKYPITALLTATQSEFCAAWLKVKKGKV